MDTDTKIEKAVRSALVSVRMEGYTVTEQMQDLCLQTLSGKLSKQECLDILRKNKKTEVE